MTWETGRPTTYLVTHLRSIFPLVQDRLHETFTSVFLARREQHFLFHGRPDSHMHTCLWGVLWSAKQMGECFVWKFYQHLHTKLYHYYQDLDVYMYSQQPKPKYLRTLLAVTHNPREYGTMEGETAVNSQADKCQRCEGVKLLFS